MMHSTVGLAAQVVYQMITHAKRCYASFYTITDNTPLQDWCDETNQSHTSESRVLITRLQRISRHCGVSVPC